MNWLVIIIIIILLAAIFAAVTRYEYRKVFHVRGKEATPFFDHFFSVHPELSVQPFACASGAESLYGVRLRYEESPAATPAATPEESPAATPAASPAESPADPPKGLIVMMHGYGLNMEHYLPQAEFFARAGYAVVLYDGVGVGRSSGKGIRGLPQHVADACAVLDYVESAPELSALPLMLYGHSSGGYAVCALSCKKKYPVKAIVSLAGYTEALGGMKAKLRKKYGPFSFLGLLLLAVFQIAEFGREASGYKSIRGLGLAGCPAFIVHSENDPILPYADHFVKIQKAFSGRPGFRFWTTDARNHNLGVPSDANERVWQLQKQMRQDPGAAESPRDDLRDELWGLQMLIDEDMLTRFLEFYDSV